MLTEQAFYDYFEQEVIGSIYSKKYVTEKDRELAANFYNPNFKKGRYLIGKNPMAKYLAEHFKCDGIIDDFCREDWCGLKAVFMADVPKDSVVVNCSSVRMIDILNSLENKNNLLVINFNRLSYLSETETETETLLSLLHTPKEQLLDYNTFKKEYYKLYSSLYDLDSKKTLLDILSFRLTFEQEYIKNYLYIPDKQYFESFLNFSKEVFIDAGSFDGMTAKLFTQYCPDYKKIYTLEPSHLNMKMVKETLKNDRDIEYLACGLSDKKEELKFNAELGSSSIISDSGPDIIQVAPLDLLINETPTFIKMDLEGWELKALKGAENYIKNDRPKLAIAVYHRSSDFRNVFKYIMDLNPNYRVYLRHYTQGWSETIMYFC